MKNNILILLFSIITANSIAQTTLTAGEVAIIGYSSDDPDQIVFLLLTDVTLGTQIKFTDRGWNSTTGTFFINTAVEGVLTWTATTALPIGTEIKLEDGPGVVPFFATLGSVVETDNFALATNGDQILVYQGTDIAPTFLNAVHLDNAEGGWGNGTSQSRTALPPGLTDGLNAIYFTEIDNATFTCPATPVEGSAETLLAEIVTIVIPIPAGGFTGNWFTTNVPLAVPIGGDCAYLVCGNTTIWDGTTWDKGVPDIASNVILNASYDTSIQGSFSACGLTVNSGFRLTIGNNTYVEVQNYVRVEGELYTETSGALVQINDEATFKEVNTGVALVNKSTTPLVNWYDYTYWSSPIEDETIGVGLSFSNAQRRFSFNAANYLDVLAEIGNTNTYVAGQDDIDDNTDAWTLANAADVMIPGSGYAASHNNVGFVSGNAYTYTFTGAFNTGIIITPINVNASPLDNDWNLIGNPYASAIDTNVFFAANSNIDGAAYLWSHNTPASVTASGDQNENFAQSDYAIITSGSGNTAGGDGIIPTDFIGSGQGFFVRGITSGTVIFNNAMRMADITSNSQFFRFNDDSNRLWLNLTSDNGIFNQILVAYTDGATSGDDGMSYDATRNASVQNAATIYTRIEGEDNKAFAIQGLNPSELNENEIIPIGFSTEIETPTIYNFSIAQFEGEFLTSNPIYIIDELLEITHNLKDSDYQFTSEIGQYEDRFKIVFNSESLSVYDYLYELDNLIIAKNEIGRINISTKQRAPLKNIKIFDIVGRELYDLNLNNEIEASLNLKSLNNSLFIAKATLSDGKVLTKKGLR